MTITITIQVQDNPLDITENELSYDLSCVIKDYLHDQKIQAKVKVNEEERRN